ncbi:HdeD family acid-resistance protein [Roseiarcus sp.]|uniref:HdeD family acid-resistance protein n=1 Tax=Roseiarcus sp. TaxID=1969460 RepID=UPI003F9757A4
MNADIQTLDIQITKDLAAQWGWFLAFGVALVVLGAAAIARSVTATMVTMAFFGWLLLLAAVVEIVAAFWVGHWAGFFQHALAAILYGVLGFIFVLRPAITAEILTFVMALFFLVGGLFHIVGSAVLGYAGWGWQVLDGVITLALGAMILAQWPASGLWVIGLFIGIDLIFYGATWIAIAWGLRGA